jgi:hypothetical protein
VVVPSGLAHLPTMRYYLTTMTRLKKSPPTEPLKVYTVKLTPAVAVTLQTLSQDASDALGWTVSSSALIRALIRQAGQQPPAWATAALHPLIEQEIAQGRVWGSKKRKGS